MNEQETPPAFNTFTIVLIWIGLLAGGSFFFDDVLDKINNPNRIITTINNENGSRDITLKQNRQGHYVAAGKINHQTVKFLLDTGATNVAIPEHLAKRLGLKKGAAHSTVTANGTSISYSTSLASISLGDIEMRNVPASISSGMQFDEVLLGMSFIKHLKMSQQGKILTIQIPDSLNRTLND
jgi:aspartyl protease family protein|tara:strand:+ start:101 stop:646 length:546 start_codon:yes stop_codon:yes gene_type:complete